MKSTLGNLRSFIIMILLCNIVFYNITSAQIPKLQKAMTYDENMDVVGWLMSEKLDGIRGYWDGKNLKTRKGNIINAPAWFLNSFPSFELDGELWSKRSDFEFIQSTVLTKNPTDAWQKISYNIFEVPNATGNFKDRLLKAISWFDIHQNKYVKVIPQISCRDNIHLQHFIEEIEKKGGEGVIVKNPTLSYHTGRSPHILKIKKTRDMEGEIISINPGKGRLEGSMGSLTLRLKDGKIFKLGTGFSDRFRKTPPTIGTIITFKYFGFTKNGIPKFASFVRIRKD